MDATLALKFLTVRANSTAEAAVTARQALSDACAVPGSDLTHLMEAAMAADSEAKPWAELFRRIERHGVREGLAKQREKATEALVSYGIALSTSLVTNAARLHEQEGLRRFLSATNGMEVDEETPAGEPTLAPDPAPAPAAVAAPKVTPAQKRTLGAINTQGVALREFMVAGGTKVTVERGEKPRKDMVEFVIDMGWAQRDTTRSLFQGQPVTLTEVGKAILAG